LIGIAIKNKDVLFTSKPNKDFNYNSNLDIETTLPLLTIPLIENDFVLGVIQVRITILKLIKHHINYIYYYITVREFKWWATKK